MSKEAWVTLATNDSYGLGALVLASSLRRTQTTRQIVIMVTPDVSQSMRSELARIFDVVVNVDILDSGDAANLALLARPELGITFTKIQAWRLAQYSKCVFLDADTLVVENCDELFQREELSAAPDPGWPDCFNSGVFVFVPSMATYQALVDFALAHGSFDGGDQGLLNMFFREWATQDIRKHLPFIYNLVSSAMYSYLPALKFFGSQVKIVHFIGSQKPWTRDRSQSSVYQAAWWAIFRQDVSSHLSQEMIVCKKLIRRDEPAFVQANCAASNHEPHFQSNIHSSVLPSLHIISERNVNDNRNYKDPEMNKLMKNYENDLSYSNNLKKQTQDIVNSPININYVEKQLNQHSNHTQIDNRSIMETFPPNIIQHSVQTAPIHPKNPTKSYMPPIFKCPNSKNCQSNIISNIVSTDEVTLNVLISNQNIKNVGTANSFVNDKSKDLIEENVNIQMHNANCNILKDNQTINCIEQINTMKNIPQYNKFQTNIQIIPNHTVEPFICKDDSDYRDSNKSEKYITDFDLGVNIMNDNSNSLTSDLNLEEHGQEYSGVAGALARGDSEEWRREAWESGDVDYMGKDSFDNIWRKICQSVGISKESSQAGQPPKISAQPTPSVVSTALPAVTVPPAVSEAPAQPAISSEAPAPPQVPIVPAVPYDAAPPIQDPAKPALATEAFAQPVTGPVLAALAPTSEALVQPAAGNETTGPIHEAIPATEAPVQLAPGTEAPVQLAPATEAAVQSAPATEAPVQPAPATEAPVQAVPATEAPAQPAPATEAPVELAPATEAPVQPAPATEAPVQPSPATEVPAQSAPPAEASVQPVPPATEAPVQLAPEASVQPAPATEAPVQPAPPATEAPVQPAPATEAPGQPAPATEAPGQPAPATEAPGQPAPTTEAPVQPATATEAPAQPAPPTTEAPVQQSPKNKAPAKPISVTEGSGSKPEAPPAPPSSEVPPQLSQKPSPPILAPLSSEAPVLPTVPSSDVVVPPSTPSDSPAPAVESANVPSGDVPPKECSEEPSTPIVIPASTPGSPLPADVAPELSKLQAKPSQPSTPPAGGSTEPPVPPKRKQGKNGKPTKGKK